jgi:dipeptidyl-peptidase-4
MPTTVLIAVLALATALLAPCSLPAETPAGGAPRITLEDYRRAERFLPANRDRYMRNGDIQHHWIGSDDRFWYRRTDESGNAQFIVFDAGTGRTSAAFDQAVVAQGLRQATHKPVPASALPFVTFRYADDGKSIEFRLGQVEWTCQTTAPSCVQHPALNADEITSPDGRWIAYVRYFNIWVKSTARGTGGRPVALTQNGVAHFAYGGAPGDSLDTVTVERTHAAVPPQLIWSPDSTHLLTHRLDERQVKELDLLQSVPDDGSMRPRLYTYRYPMIGDEHLPLAEPLILSVPSAARAQIDTPPILASFHPPIIAHNIWWSDDARSVYFVDTDRYARHFRLRVADAATGKTRTLLEETSKTFIDDPANPVIAAVLKNGDVIWFSERDGWGHLYYFNSDGSRRNQITRGEWVVRSIVRVDEHAHKVYFTAGGVDKRANPYFQHLYSIDFDGSGLLSLTPEDADHLETYRQRRPSIGDPETNPFSASGRIFVDSYSRPDRPPELAVRANDGRLLRVLEVADISALKVSGFTAPEPFEVTAADGKTLLYGNLFRPSHLDPAKHYPVLDSIYPGPQTIRSQWGFSNAVFDHEIPQTLADLGFIVVTLDSRGTPYRSKAFLSESYGVWVNRTIADDHVAGITQLARRYPYMDVARVGIYGHSGGGIASTRLLLLRPDFYKVAVSAAGVHDQRGYQSVWGDVFTGGPNLGAYANMDNTALAANLRGKLLLIHGDTDDNVHPLETMRMVAALIKANKPFDMLIVPGANHGGTDFSGPRASPYVRYRAYDYLLRNLMGVLNPPWPAGLESTAGPASPTLEDD